MEQPPATVLENTDQTTRARATIIYGRDLSWYVRIVKTVTLGMSCYGVIVAIAAAAHARGTEYLEASLFLMKTACFLWIGARVGGRYREPIRVAAMTGGFAGMGTGLVIAFSKLFVIQEAWTLFNCITEPVVTGIVGYVVAGLGGIAFGPPRRNS